MPSGSMVAWQGLHTVHHNAVVCVLWLEWQALGMFQATTEGMESASITHELWNFMAATASSSTNSAAA
jgi:hypothetical protein